MNAKPFFIELLVLTGGFDDRKTIIQGIEQFSIAGLHGEAVGAGIKVLPQGVNARHVVLFNEVKSLHSVQQGAVAVAHGQRQQGIGNVGNGDDFAGEAFFQEVIMHQAPLLDDNPLVG